MRLQFVGILAVVAAGATLPLMADTPLTESAAFTYAADTRPSPRTVKTAAELAEITGGTFKVAWRSGETVRVSAPDGTASTLVSDASAAGTATLALDAGGVWTLERSGQGMSHDASEITVRRSLYGTLGNGTAASPAKLVDGDELRDYGADENYVFALDGAEGLLSRLVIPSGCRMEEAGDGVWRLVSSADGSQYAWAEIVYPADAAQEGPNRKLKKREAPPVAYSGDDWAGDLSKAATVTFTPPEGSGLEATTWNRTGEGAESFTFNAKGVWMVTLTFADSTTRTALIDMQTSGLLIVVR